FGTTDVPALLARLRTDPKYRFKSREEKISYSQAALARAKAAVPSVFGLLPKADVVIKPYPAFREKNAPNEYNPPAEDGSRPPRRAARRPRRVLHQRVQGGEAEPRRRRVDGVSRDDSGASPAGSHRAGAEGDPPDRPLHLQQRV